MSDGSATAVYQGTGLTTSAWRSRGAATQSGADGAHVDLTTGCDNDVTLEGPEGQAYGDEVGSKVPNLNVEHHSLPSRIRTEPASMATQQNPLTAGRPGTAVRRQPHGYTPRGK